MATRKEIQEAATRLTASLVDAGKVIEGGWAGFHLAVVPENASSVQVIEMRKAFFAGACHLFASMMSMLDPGSEPTDRDLRRMDQIQKELDSFEQELLAQYPLFQ